MDFAPLKLELHTIRVLKFGLGKNTEINVMCGHLAVLPMNFAHSKYHLRQLIFLLFIERLQKEIILIYLRSTPQN